MEWLSGLIGFLAGALVTVQAGSNAKLKESFGAPLPALVVNYLFGITVIVGGILLGKQPLPALAQIRSAPWWAWIGGLAGAAYGLTAIVLAHSLGAATLVGLTVSGQLIASVLFDHFGWLGFEVHPAGWARIGGCALMLVGFGLIARY